MTTDNDNEGPIALPGAGGYSNDPRNPGAAGMPGANPGFSDPGQRQTDGNGDDPREAPNVSPPADIRPELLNPGPGWNSSRGSGPQRGAEEAATSPEDRAALDRWSLYGGSS